jgi:hypothetical protein
VTVSGSVQVSGASAQDFTQKVKYTVTNPENANLTRDYWVQCRMVQNTSSYAAITAFGFYNEDNPGVGLAQPLAAKIDQATGRITVYAPVGSGLTEKIISPRFTATGQVSVNGSAQVSGGSARMFDAPVTYTVIAPNGNNRRDYSVSVRELKSPIYVNCDALGYNDGTSWENAFISLKAACEAAGEFPEAMPKEIWIAAGTYTPGNTYYDYFPLTANTSYIGGFAGHETDKNQRNIAANTVTLCGQGILYVPDGYFYTMFRPVYTGSIFNHAPINGDLTFENLHLKDCGDPIHITSYPIENCIRGNVVINGIVVSGISNGIGVESYSGGLRISNSICNIVKFASYSSKTEQVIIEDSVFEGDTYVSIGIADWLSTPLNVEIRNTRVNTRWGVFLKASNVLIDRVDIASSIDSGLYIRRANTVKISNSNIRDSSRTQADYVTVYPDQHTVGLHGWEGGGTSIQCNGTTEITNTTIERVEACNGGGIYYCYSGGVYDDLPGTGSGGGSLTLRGVTIRNANALYKLSTWNPCGYGGGLYFYSNGRLNIIDSTFENCTSEVNNGAIYCYSSNNSITGSRFINCTSPGSFKVLDESKFSTRDYVITP